MMSQILKDIIQNLNYFNLYALLRYFLHVSDVCNQKENDYEIYT